MFLGLLKNEKEILNAREAPDHPPVVLADVVRAWVDVRAVEVHAVGAAATGPRSGPIVPVGITAVERRTTHGPRIDEIVWIRA